MKSSGRLTRHVQDDWDHAAITEIQSDLDAEIAALEAKLAKACQVKEGMMQDSPGG